MPAHKTRVASGRLQHHQRSSSGGSSRVGLNNLQISQKEPNGGVANAAIKQQQSQLKRTGHSAVDVRTLLTVIVLPSVKLLFFFSSGTSTILNRNYVDMELSL